MLPEPVRAVGRVAAIVDWELTTLAVPLLSHLVPNSQPVAGRPRLDLRALLIAGTFQLPGFEVIRLVTFGVVGLAPVAFLLGLLDARLARSGVAEMIVRLNAEPAPDLRRLIARALRDDSLTLAYWLPQYETWAGADGEPVTLPGPDDARGVTVVEQRGQPLAALLYHSSVREEPELVTAVSAAAAIALENGRLQAELRARYVGEDEWPDPGLYRWDRLSRSGRCRG